MAWNVDFHPDFDLEFKELKKEVKREIFAQARLLKEFGPLLGRPHVDTLEGSRYANMKELRFKTDGGVWRVTFAFDPERRAILLIAGDKSGVGQKMFYKALIKKADNRFKDHLSRR